MDYDSLSLEELLKLANDGDAEACAYAAVCYFDGSNGAEKDLEKAFYYFAKGAELGSKIAQYNLGSCYYYGYGVDKNYEKAFYWFSESAKQNHPRALCYLGYFYDLGICVEKSQETAFKYYLKSAELGYNTAMVRVADCYHYGNGVEQNYVLSIEWYRKAIENGSAEAMLRLGWCYEHGEGVEQSIELAFNYYKMSAEHGSVEGKYNTAICYAHGMGVEKNDELAFYWFLKCAEDGDSDAQFSVARRYEEGNGVEVDQDKAIYWYEKAAEQDNSDAIYNLAICYENGDGVEIDKKKAFELYLRAAEMGSPEAQYNVAVSYERGDGVEENEEQAIYWYAKSAEQGFKSSQFNLAVCYENGEGVKQDYEKALYWYTKAAEQDHIYATYNLALLYDKGLGCEVDYDKAFSLFEKAAKTGHVKSMIKLSDYYENGKSVEVDLVTSTYWMAEAAKKDDLSAINSLAIRYEEGRGVEKDIAKAIELYTYAAERGNVYAQFNLGLCYEFGDGVPKNYEIAYGWYKKSADQDYEYAQYRLFIFYRDGLFVEKSEVNASYWCEKAAENGLSDAQYALACRYDLGIGVKVSPKKALYWCEKAVEQGYLKAITLRAIMYLYEQYGPVNEEKAVELFISASEQGDVSATHQLALCYKKGIGVKKDLKKALKYLKDAYNNGLTEIEADIEEVEKEIEVEKHKKLKVSSDVDVFISWNHFNYDQKEKLKNDLIRNGIKVWESDEDAEGDLDIDVEYAIRHVKSYVVILSKEAFDSKYMPKEVNMMYERMMEDNLPPSLVKIWTTDSGFDYEIEIDKLPKGHPYRKLIKLSKDYSNDFSNVVTAIKKKILEFKVIDYQRKLRKQFDVFPISLSDLHVSDEDSSVVSSLKFEDGFVNRDLYDSLGKPCSTKELLKIKEPVLIYGEGGSGKSLFIKNLIRNDYDTDHFYFFLPCAEIRQILDFNLDIYDAISRIVFKFAECDPLTSEEVKMMLNNEERDFYLIFDAIDEADSCKKDIINLVNTIALSSYSPSLHFIFTSRNESDKEIIMSALNKPVTTLKINPMSEEDIIKLFDNIYQRNIKEIGFTNISASDKMSGKGISRDIFISNLALIADDIKKNPLLISNLIYVYFATREIQTQKFYILEKSNEILIDSLEKERKTISIQKNILEGTGVTIRTLLETIAYKKNVNRELTIKAIVEELLTKNGVEDVVNKAEDIYNYLRSRKIITGEKISHDIYSSYFTARYIFSKSFKYDDDELECKYIALSSLPFLEGCTNKFLSLESNLWPSISLDFVSKIDYEIHNFRGEDNIFDRNDLSYPAFEKSMEVLLNDTNGISSTAYDTLKTMVKNKNILYHGDLIEKYMLRDSQDVMIKGNEYNTTFKIPVCFLIDASDNTNKEGILQGMGEIINRFASLFDGLKEFGYDFDISLLSYNDNVNVIEDFHNQKSNKRIRFDINGEANLSYALAETICKLNNKLIDYINNSIDHRKPWLILLMSGEQKIKTESTITVLLDIIKSSGLNLYPFLIKGSKTEQEINDLQDSFAKYFGKKVLLNSKETLNQLLGYLEKAFKQK